MWCWSGGKGVLNKTISVCYSIVYHYNGAQWYPILLGLALYLSSASVSSVFMVLYIIFGYIFLGLSFLQAAWWEWPLMWLTNYRPSLLWLCWLDHLTQLVQEMAYSVLSGTLNPTILYDTLRYPSALMETTRNCRVSTRGGGVTGKAAAAAFDGIADTHWVIFSMGYENYELNWNEISLFGLILSLSGIATCTRMPQGIHL